ncbi:HDIG domain-containing protein [bacterium]|nr:HDIG domain-containing protein [bacterium]
MMGRAEALDLIHAHVQNKNLRKHMLAVEAVMSAAARHFQMDEALWGLAGLLHDLDYDETVNDFPRHGFRTAEILKDSDVPEEALHAIQSHPGHVARDSLMDKVLYAADPITGLIVAAVLMHPEKKLEALDIEFIERRFREKRFAAGANREQIQTCETFGMPLRDFLELSLKAMQSIHGDLGF